MIVKNRAFYFPSFIFIHAEILKLSCASIVISLQSSNSNWSIDASWQQLNITDSMLNCAEIPTLLHIPLFSRRTCEIRHSHNYRSSDWKYGFGRQGVMHLADENSNFSGLLLVFPIRCKFSFHCQPFRSYKHAFVDFFSVIQFFRPGASESDNKACDRMAHCSCYCLKYICPLTPTALFNRS